MNSQTPHPPQGVFSCPLMPPWVSGCEFQNRHLGGEIVGFLFQVGLPGKRWLLLQICSAHKSTGVDGSAVTIQNIMEEQRSSDRVTQPACQLVSMYARRHASLWTLSFKNGAQTSSAVRPNPSIQQSVAHDFAGS